MADKYGTQERAALLLLLVEGREVPNAEMRNDFGIELTPAGRAKLNKAELLVTRKEGRRLVHRITPEGERWCEKTLATIETPPRAGALARVGFECLRVIARYLRDNNIPLRKVLCGPGVGPDASGGEDGGTLEALIRIAYSELSAEPQDWVRLAKLRPMLDGASKDEVDEVLRAMSRTGLVHLAQSANRKALTDADHAAAIRIGSEDKHLVAIEES